MSDNTMEILGDLLGEVFKGKPDGESVWTFSEEEADKMKALVGNYEAEVKRPGIVDIKQEWDEDDMKKLKSIKKMLLDNNWEDVDGAKHHKFRCPCGEHQISFALTPSDHRALKNLQADIKRMDCPSLRHVFQDDADFPWDENESLVCHFCRCELQEARFKKDWIYHDGIFACLSHKGVKKWHKSKCREKKSA